MAAALKQDMPAALKQEMAAALDPAVNRPLPGALSRAGSFFHGPAPVATINPPMS